MTDPTSSLSLAKSPFATKRSLFPLTAELWARRCVGHSHGACAVWAIRMVRVPGSLLPGTRGLPGDGGRELRACGTGGAPARRLFVGTSGARAP